LSCPTRYSMVDAPNLFFQLKYRLQRFRVCSVSLSSFRARVSAAPSVSDRSMLRSIASSGRAFPYAAVSLCLISCHRRAPPGAYTASGVPLTSPYREECSAVVQNFPAYASYECPSSVSGVMELHVSGCCVVCGRCMVVTALQSRGIKRVVSRSKDHCTRRWVQVCAACFCRRPSKPCGDKVK